MSHLRLPQELIDRICDYLKCEDLKRTLLVSRGFQYASERASCAFASYELGEQNVERFLDLYGGRRFAYLNDLSFWIRMRDYVPGKEERMEHGGEGNGRDGDRETKPTNLYRESLQELHEKDKDFTNQINIIFDAIHTVEQRGASGRINLTIYVPQRKVQSNPHRKYSSWRVHLLNPAKLPHLASIRTLHVKRAIYTYLSNLENSPSTPKMDPRVVIDLAVKLPNLEFLSCQLGFLEWAQAYKSLLTQQLERDWEGPRRDARRDLAKAIESAVLPATLRHAQLNFMDLLFQTLQIDHSKGLPDLVSPAPYDPLSSSLYFLSQQLRSLDLVGVFDSTLFYPSIDAKPPFFPHLELLKVTFHISTPSGEWYFNGPKEYRHHAPNYQITEAHYPPLHDTENEHCEYKESRDRFDTLTLTKTQYRVFPNNALLTPFLTAFAKAAAPTSMPSLKAACLWAPLQWNPDDLPEFPDHSVHQINGQDIPSAWGIAYIGPRVTNVWQWVERAEVRRLWWKTWHWRPTAELNTLFRGIGGDNVPIVERWGNQGGREPPISSDWKAFERFKIVV